MIKIEYKYENAVIDCILGAGDYVDDEVVDELEEVYAKAKALDVFIKYEEHTKTYKSSDADELALVFKSVMEQFVEEEE